MEGNLHKSDAGWARFRARTNNGETARRAEMRHSANRPSKKIVATKNAATDKAFQPHLRNRRKVVIDG